jgi:hypothetical protein
MLLDVCKMRIYLDTCVYCRPFDDQSQDRIEKETKAFIEILKLAEMGKVTIVSSDVLIGRVTGADALHIASSGETKYFITCDGFILLKDECINNFMEKRGYSVEVTSITKFMEDKRI